MNKPLEAVITDLDGSLLGDYKKIGEQDLKTIARLKEMGIPFFIATGRHQAITRVYAKQVGTQYPAITSNGSLIYDFAKEQVVHVSFIDPEDVTALKEFSLANGIYYFVYSERHCFLNDGEPNAEFFKMDMALMELADEGEFLLMGKGFEPNDHKIVKFMLPCCTNETLAKLAKIPCVRDGRIVPSFSGEMFVDVNPIGSSKGDAAKLLSELYGFSLEHTLAMGDNFNDETMLGSVGYAVVPETAAEEVRSFADFVTCSNNENPLTYAINSLFPDLLG